jgi:hypothetical protein
MMSAHTPGPWIVIPSPHGAYYKCVQFGDDESYASLEMRPEDALLVAAAPELLKTLREACNMLSAIAGDIEDGYSLETLRGKVVQALVNVRDDGRAAIAKAEGRS